MLIWAISFKLKLHLAIKELCVLFTAHHLFPLSFYISISAPTLLLTLLVFPVPVATTAWQVTDDGNNSGRGCPCSVEHKQHDKLPSSVCFANSPHRSPPRPVVTFCCVLYMQIPANQLARCSPCSLRCPLWLKWIDCRLKSTPASLPEAEGSAGHDKVNGGGTKLFYVSVFCFFTRLLPSQLQS